MTSVDLASDYAERLVKRERVSAGGVDRAIHRVGAEAGVGYRTVWGLWHRRRKTADQETTGRLRAALIRRLEAEVRHLEHELQMVRACGVDPRDCQISEIEADLAKARKALGLP
jgi:hypothetical protein